MGGYVEPYGGAEKGDGCCVLVCPRVKRQRVLKGKW